MNAKLFFGSPESPPLIARHVLQAINSAQVTAMDAAYAYLSLAGVDSFLSSYRADQHFARANKRWVAGIHHGITEPAAIDEIASISNTEVRVYSPTGRIEIDALRARPLMHAKVARLAFGGSSLFIVGSANITRAAIGDHAKNFESCIAVDDSPTAGQIANTRQFTAWFRSVWRDSLVATPQRIDRYSRVRQRFIERHPVIQTQLDQPPMAGIGDRECLWIEAGQMSGGDRNQIEFGPSLAQFFGPIQRATIRLRIVYDAIERADRPLSHKVTQWGTEIWRLSLITSRQGGPRYAGRTMHLRRREDARGQYFELQVEDCNSAIAGRWRARAHRNGTVAETGTAGQGRTYGVY